MSEHTDIDRSDAADAARFRWLLAGNGFFLEEKMLCGGPACCAQTDQDDARREIDAAMLADGVSILAQIKPAPWYLFDFHIDGMRSIAVASEIASRAPSDGECLLLSDGATQQFVRIRGIESVEKRSFLEYRHIFGGRLKWLMRLLRIEPRIVMHQMLVYRLVLGSPLNHRFQGDVFPFPTRNNKLFLYTCEPSNSPSEFQYFKTDDRGWGAGMESG